MRIWFNPAKLSAYGLTPGDVQAALNKENVELPSGKITGNSTELTVRTFGRLTTEEDFNNVIVKNVNGSDIRLKDVAEAVLGPENEETILKESRIPMIALALVPQPGSNYVAISDEFYKRLDQLKKRSARRYQAGYSARSNEIHQEVDLGSRRNTDHFTDTGGTDHLFVLPQLVDRLPSVDRYSCITDRRLLYYVPERFYGERIVAAGYSTGYRPGGG